MRDAYIWIDLYIFVIPMTMSQYIPKEKSILCTVLTIITIIYVLCIHEAGHTKRNQYLNQV